MIIGSPTSQSPKAYDLANLSGAQIATRLANAVSAGVRQSLDTALQDSGYRFKIHPAETAVGLVEANLTFGRDLLDVKRYGAKGDGVTDDIAAFNTAWNVAKQLGGGRILLSDGATYMIASAPNNVNIPTQQTDGSIVNGANTVSLYLTGGNNIDFDFAGSTVKTSIAIGGVLTLVDASSHIRFIAPRFQGTQVMSTGVVSLAIATAGSGLTNGTYNNVSPTGGAGGGCVVNVTIAGGVLSVAPAIQYVGGSYALNDTLSFNIADIGGTGVAPTLTVTSITGAGPAVQTAAPAALAFAALTGNCFDITVEDFYSDSMYTGIWCIANPNGAVSTVQHVAIKGNTRIRNGYYGVALHNCGDDCTIENLYAYRMNRPLFAYGVHNFKANVTSDQGNHGFQSIIKAYSRLTRNGSVRYFNKNGPGQSSAVSRLALQVQCDPAVINPPPYLDNIDIFYNEENMASDGTGEAIGFDYFGGAGGTVQQATSVNLLFQNITVRGFSGNALYTSVQLTNTANFCPINYDEWRGQWPLAANDPRQNGFVSSQKFAYTPTLQFGGAAATGWVFSLNSIEYYVSGGLCHVYGRFSVQTKGSKAGALTISMPLPSRQDATRNPILHAFALSGVAGLNGPLTGFVSVGAGTAVANPYVQNATNATAMTDANFVTGDVTYEAHYPV